MKVLQINAFHYRLGGSETVYFNTTELLEREGHEVMHLALKWEKNIPSKEEKFFANSKESRKGLLRHIKNLTTYFYNGEAARNLEALIKEKKPDIAQIHLFWGQITPSVLPILKKYNVPVIFTIHEYRMVCPAYTFRNGYGKVCEECKGKLFYKCFLNKCSKDSRIVSLIMAMEQYFRNAFLFPPNYIDGMIYVSSFAKKMHEKYMPQLKEKQNTVLYNLSDEIDTVVEKKSNEKYYLYYGRLSNEKGIMTLIEAFKERPNSKLKIAGTGALEENIKAYISAEKINNIELVGFKSGNDLKEIVRNAYFIVVPSEWYENNPMTIIEGYSMATPVIGASIGGIPEIIEDTKTGYLFTSGNKGELAKAIEKAENLSEEEYHIIQKNTIDFANKHFNKELYYDKLMNFYKEVIKQKTI